MRRASALLALAALFAGCMGGGTAELAESELPELVLQPGDLPEFERFDEGALLSADMPTGQRGDPGRFGRRGGWKARYKRSGTPETRGPLVVESRVDLFEDDGGAAEDLDAYQASLADAEEGIVPELVTPAPELGTEAVAVTQLQENALNDVRFFTITWRDENVTASVLVNGFDGKLSLDEALELARKQQRRIAAAAAESG